MNKDNIISENHKASIDWRLNQIENGETCFQTWNIIKQKYEKDNKINSLEIVKRKNL